MEDNDFGGLARDLERARLRKEAAANPPSDIMDILHERNKTHGDFADHARITQRLKTIVYCEAGMREEWGREPLSPEQLESLDMICHKIGRIIAGDADFADHWDDIAGYAKLCSRLPDTYADGLAGDFMGHGPTTAPTDWWSDYTPSEIPELYPFTSHRTMAEIMAEEAAACPLDGRNCDHDHPAFGEGDETTPKWDAMNPTRCVNFGKDNTPDVLKIGPFDDMHPCNCERGRCKIENGRTIGSRVFCCQAEEGR